MFKFTPAEVRSLLLIVSLAGLERLAQVIDFLFPESKISNVCTIVIVLMGQFNDLALEKNCLFDIASNMHVE